VDVRVNDRGGFSHALDLSYAAFAQLAPPRVGWLRIHYEVIPGPGQPPAAPAVVPAPAVVAAPAVPQPNPGRYTVRAGDTLGAIARRFGLSVPKIADWNGLANPNLLRVGQVLVLTPPRAPEPAPAQPAAREAAPRAAPQADANVYVVQPGDVLWSIAARLGVDAGALAVVNNLGPNELIFPNQRLLVPSREVHHVVAPGDTLTSIAAAYATSVADLVTLNELANPDMVVIGQRLRVR
jgi:LysM repeat protein